jgi:galactose-1-phosphate uridylyltransferase
LGLLGARSRGRKASDGQQTIHLSPTEFAPKQKSGESVSKDCPFCDLASRELVAENDLTVAFRDSFPVNPGHTLIIPRRHVATWFDATREEQIALLDLVDPVKARLDRELRPDGYNHAYPDVEQPLAWA